ncbi:MAG: hypothetical protein JWM60_1856 [Solirubrobacterales bacterium]|nr:hypothetical protein [Solirubrobacterales bacterium]
MRTDGQRTEARGRPDGIIRLAPCALLAVIAALLLLSPAASAYHAKRACGEPPPGRAACLAMRVLLGGTGASAQATRGAGATRGNERTKPYPGFLTPELLHDAYQIPNETAEAASQTIAVVDAYDDPTAEADLAVYDQQFGLPACTTANGCFKKVNQNGQAGPLPKVEGGWASEISIDVQMAHAICQSCKVLLVEAKTEEFSDLGAGVLAAAELGATEISNSYGGTEEPGDVSLANAYYNHPGIVVAASSGDCGYLNSACIHNPFGANFPADSPNVLSVGGTALSESAGAWTSTAWVEGGSGCSEVFSAPLWQSATAGFPATGCGSSRAIADVAAIGDPNTGVDIYDSTPEEPGAPTGWGVWGGTSVASPILAAEFALAGGAGGVAYPAATLYGHAGEAANLYDVTGGSTGACEGHTICTATAGFDGPTGVGSPIGLGAFALSGAPESTSPPTISGYAEEADTLTAVHGGWTGAPTGYAYQWERCGFSGGGCRTVPGATAQSYTIPQGDAGYTIRVRETARNGNGPNSAASGAVGPVASDVPQVTAVTPLAAITGAHVLAEGAALDQATSVTVAGLPASFVVVSPAKLDVTVPSGAFKGKIVIATPHGVAISKQKFAATLTIRSFSPTAGVAGTRVTIKGVGFGPSSKVSFAGTPATVTSASAKKLKVIVPAGAASGQITVTNTAAPAGTISSAIPFTP